MCVPEHPEQIEGLLMGDLQLLSAEPDNEITLTAFRLLTMDLLVLYHVMNEGTINVLGGLYFLRLLLWLLLRIQCRTLL